MVFINILTPQVEIFGGYDLFSAAIAKLKMDLLLSSVVKNETVLQNRQTKE